MRIANEPQAENKIEAKTESSTTPNHHTIEQRPNIKAPKANPDLKSLRGKALSDALLKKLAHSKFGSQEFRRFLREDVISKHYSGFRHLYILCAGIFGIIGCSIYFIKDPSYIEMLTIPLALLLGNLVEYTVHRFLMHHKMKFFEAMFNHLIIHHGFYSSGSGENDYEEHRDFWALLIPKPMVLSIFFLGVAPALFVSWFFLSTSTNTIALLNASYWFYYLNYEFFHFASHAPKGSWPARIPGIQVLFRHHRLHHDPKLMSHYNFNITWPIFDWLFGTLYVENK